MATQDAQAIVKGLEDCRKRNNGQYIENVCSFGKKEFDWDRSKSMAAIKAEKEIGLVRQVINSDKCLHIVETCNESMPLTPEERIISSSPSKPLMKMTIKKTLLTSRIIFILSYCQSRPVFLIGHCLNPGPMPMD